AHTHTHTHTHSRTHTRAHTHTRTHTQTHRHTHTHTHSAQDCLLYSRTHTHTHTRTLTHTHTRTHAHTHTHTDTQTHTHTHTISAVLYLLQLNRMRPNFFAVIRSTQDIRVHLLISVFFSVPDPTDSFHMTLSYPEVMVQSSMVQINGQTDRQTERQPTRHTQ